MTNQKAERACEEFTFSRRQRLVNQLKSIIKNPYNIMVVVSVLLMVYLILIPLGQMIIDTFTLAEADVARVEKGTDQQHIPADAVDTVKKFSDHFHFHCCHRCNSGFSSGLAYGAQRPAL